MKITARETHNYVELKVDEIDDTFYKGHSNEDIKKMIENLKEIIEILETYVVIKEQ